MRPMRIPATGRMITTKMVSLKLMEKRKIRYTTMVMGSLNNICRELMMEASTSWTSLEIRAITSPFRASV